MAYTALYRRLRPKSFDDVVGQSHIVRTLLNQIETGRITHAYLFCGTRGTGKTSTAKIFAKAINCLEPVGGEPCGKCQICSAVDENRSMNIIEIDAASNNGVDNIREIREEVKYPPAEGNYKVYIIDEVHMLSIGAFNALLKTLEEPPEHVVFILATTDPQKIPATILSRCQRFDFRRISNSDMVKTLRKYMDEEKVDIEDTALMYIARLSDGALRDALSILDQCMAFYFDEKITVDKVHEITGSVDDDIFFQFADALSENNSSECMNIIENIVMLGRDMNQFIMEFILHLRNVLIAASVDSDSTALDFSENKINRLKKQSENLSKESLIEFINSFSELMNKVKYSSNPRVMLEVLCIKLCNPISEKSYSDIFEKIKLLEKKIENAPMVAFDNKKEPVKPIKNVIIKNKSVPDDIKSVIEKWSEFVNRFEALDKAILNLVSPGSLGDNTLYIVCTTTGHYDQVLKIKSKILEELENMFEKSFEISVIIKEQYNLKHNELFGADDLSVEKVKDNKEIINRLNWDFSSDN